MRILVLDTAKGGVATALMLHEMRSRIMAPAAIVFNTVNTTLAQDAALGDLTMLPGFEIDFRYHPQALHGALVEIDPDARTIRVLGPEEAAGHAGQGAAGLPRVHGPR